MSPYLPAPWLPGPHAMTAWGRVVRRPPRIACRRERWELPDGDFLDVDRLDGARPDAPVVVVLHGLEGSSRAAYVRGLLAEARAAGFAGCGLNFRGCSGELNRLPRFYHSGDTGDLAFAVDRLVAERPGRPVVLAGFSLGGNVAAKYLGERGADLPAEVLGGAIVSVPFDLAACARALDAPSPAARLYRGLFLRSLRRKAVAKAALHPGALDSAAAASARTFADFDGCVTAPLHGFSSAADYWYRSSSGPLLGRIRRPLLAIAAADDPFVPEATLPRAAARENPLVTLEVTPRGGHLAFVEGPPWSARRWAELRAVAALAALLG